MAHSRKQRALDVSPNAPVVMKNCEPLVLGPALACTQEENSVTLHDQSSRSHRSHGRCHMACAGYDACRSVPTTHSARNASLILFYAFLRSAFDSSLHFQALRSTHMFSHIRKLAHSQQRSVPWTGGRACRVSARSSHPGSSCRPGSSGHRRELELAW